MEKELNPQEQILKFCDENTPADIYEKLRLSVYGQDDALKEISILVYSWLYDLSLDENAPKKHFFICGASGTGKTHIATQLGRILPVESVIADASSISSYGFSGNNIDDLIFPSDDERERTWGVKIVFLDEIDKLLEPRYTSTGENVALQVQNNILKKLDGGEIVVKGEKFKCNRILFIGLGAFDYEKIRVKKADKGIGFCKSVEANEEYKQNLTIDDIISLSGSSQFCTRFLSVVNLDKPDWGVYYRIAVDAMHEIKRIHGHESFNMKNEELIRIAKEAVESGDVGCRSVRSKVWSIFMKQYNPFDNPKIAKAI